MNLKSDGVTRFLKVTTGPAHRADIDSKLFTLRGEYCEYCDGDGWIRVQTDAIRTGSATCPECKGEGTVYREGFTEEYTFDNFSDQNSAVVKTQQKCLVTDELKCLDYKNKGATGKAVIGEFFGKSVGYTIEWGVR